MNGGSSALIERDPDRGRYASFEHFDSKVVYLSEAGQQPRPALIFNRGPVDEAILCELGHGAQPVTVTYTSWRRDGLLEPAERDGTFVSTFIEKLQQASSNNRIFHKLFQYALHPRTNNSGRPCTYLRRMRSGV